MSILNANKSLLGYISDLLGITLLDIFEIFEDIRQHLVENEAVDNTDIGQALSQIMLEIDEITIATLNSISIETFLKTMHYYHKDLPQTTS
jgi:Rrf2 family nitric oxide-sensitive transcriptional repressor